MSMSEFGELFGVDSDRALKFFLSHLTDEVTSRDVTWMETVYVASMLAHYALTSRCDPTHMSPSDLSGVFDSFVFPAYTSQGPTGIADPKILELAGAQTLFLVGFFRDQSRRRHNVKWYDQLGQSFFEQASYRLNDPERSVLLRQVATHFHMWAVSCQSASRAMRDQRYLLRTGSGP